MRFFRFLVPILSLLPTFCFSQPRIQVKNPKIKTRIIVNPKSGTNRKENIDAIINSYLDKNSFSYEILYTEGPNHATTLSEEAVRKKYDLVIAIGGDGTVNEVGKALIGTKTAMGIVPSGSGNGLAKHLHIPTDPEKALQIINGYHTIAIDTIQINNDKFLGIAGIGFDAHIAWKFAKSKLRGFWSYAAVVLKDYPKYEPPVFEIEIDGKKIKKEGLLISFANSSQYGNNIKIAPQARIDDGKLHLVILKNPPLFAIPDILTKLKKGTISRSKYYESIPCKEVKIHKKEIQAHIDGEPAHFHEGIHLKVVPQSLKILVPKEIPKKRKRFVKKKPFYKK